MKSRGSDQTTVIAKLHSSKKFCRDDSVAENEPLWFASMEFCTSNCAVKSKDHNPTRDKMTLAMNKNVLLAEGAKVNDQRAATPGLRVMNCQDKLQIPARTAPKRLVSTGATYVAEISRMVVIVRNKPM